jgi:oligopeptide/dipeptide ABC transporter ATP-binding protein
VKPLRESLAPAPPLLEVRDLSVHFPTAEGAARALDGVSFTVATGQTVCVVGESGCGKSTLALALLRLHPESALVSGAIHFQGTSLLDLPPRAMRAIRGRGIALVFQEPSASLNPIYTLGSQVSEVVRLHCRQSRRTAWHTALDLLRAVQLAEPDRVARLYAHEASGGMLQRVVIAMALAGQPRLLIADEPTASLDVTVQADILILLRSLRASLGMALLLITHDFAIVGQMADAVIIMYAGKIVETGSLREVFEHPRHPYTAALLRCRPRPGHAGRLPTIEGSVPPATRLPAGCRFRERCPYQSEHCREQPPLVADSPSHEAACWHSDRLTPSG